MLTLRIPPIPKPVEPPPEAPVEKERPTLARPALAPVRFPRSLTTLSVSWVHGDFEAVAINRGEVTGRWEKPATSDDTIRFAELLKEACAQTGYRGSTVQLLLAHPRLTHQLIETPPAKAAALRALVQRQVERLKGFEGAPAWAFQPALPTKSSNGVLAHLLPKNLLDQLVAGAERVGLHLVSVVPVTAVLHAQLSNLPLQPEEIALLAADTAGITTVIVGRHDGHLLLARSLDAGKSHDPNALVVDLNRTLLFASQQLGTAVGSVWLFGPSTQERLAALEGKVQVRLQPSTETRTPFYWAEEAARLTSDQAPNLITTEQRNAPQRRVLLRLAIASAVIVFLAAAATVVFCEILSRRERAQMEEIAQRLDGLKTRHEALQRARRKIDAETLFARTVLDDRPAPIPVWFLAYLSEALPAELQLTNFHVRHTGAGWEVQLAGSSTITNTPVSEPLPREARAFAEALHTGPFHVEWKASSEGEQGSTPSRPKSAVETIASWASRLAAQPQNASLPGSQGHFSLEGTMQ